MKGKPLTRYFSKWREEQSKRNNKGDYWYKESDIREAVRWLVNKVEDKKIKSLISCAFPEIWFSKERREDRKEGGFY